MVRAPRRQRQEVSVTEQLRAYISATRLSLNELGRRTGVAPSQLSRFLRGGQVTTLTVDRLCRVLGLTLQPGPAPRS
jgi:transcriptional regulator with XRE-family HTH domain